MWLTYILLCENGSFYTGSTNNLEKRFRDHLNGKGARYTKIHKPIKVVFTEKFESKSEALKREAQIKKLTKKEKNNLINNYLSVHSVMTGSTNN